MKKLAHILVPVLAAVAIIAPLMVYRLMSPSEPAKACTSEVGTISGQLVVDMQAKTVQYEGSTEVYTLEHTGSC